MVLAVAEPLSTAATPRRRVLELAPDVDRNGDVGRRSDLAMLAARRIACTARREELAVRRESLWSDLLDLDGWRRDVTARCRGACWRRQEWLEARAGERASMAAADGPEHAGSGHAGSTGGGLGFGPCCVDEGARE